MVDKSSFDYLQRPPTGWNYVPLANAILGVFSTSVFRSLLNGFEQSKLTLLKALPNTTENTNLKNVVEYHGLLKAGINKRFICTPKQGVTFMLKDVFLGDSKRSITKDGVVVWVLNNLYQGGSVMGLTYFALYSYDYKRIMVAGGESRLINYGSSKYEGPYEFYKHRLSKYGVYALFKGAPIYCIAKGIYGTFYFGIFDSLKIFAPEFPISYLFYSVIGISSAFIGQAASYPLDIIRRTQIVTKYKYDDAL